MRGIEEIMGNMGAVVARQLKPGAKLRKAGHNFVAVFLVLVLSVWQTPAVAFAGPEDEGAANVAAVAGDEAAAPEEEADTGQPGEAADASGDASSEEPEPQTEGVEGEQPEAAAQASEDSPAADEAAEALAGEGAAASEETADETADEDTAQEESAEEEAVTYRIEFDANGGVLREGGKDDALKDIAEDAKAKLPKKPYEREGYTFAGWNTVPDPQDPSINKDDAKFVPDHVELQALAYRYVVLTQDNATEDELEKAIETSDGTKIAVFETTDENKDDERDAQGRTIETCDLREQAKDNTLKLYAQWKENPADEEAAAGEEEAADETDSAEGVEYALEGEAEAVSLQGEAARNPRLATQRLASLDGLDEAQANEIADELFGEDADAEGEDAEDEDATEEEPPRSLDGSNIDSIAAKWITKDTTDNDSASRLYIKPNDDSAQMVLMRINYSLSGEFNYAPGDVVITIPTHIFKDRNGNPYGKLTIPYPQAPSTKKEFNWKQVGDTYVITNTRDMPAASKGYIEFSIDGLVPHQLVDMEVSDEFDAYIEVVTNQGNTIALRSNALDAQFDTEAILTQVTKRRQGDVQRVKASSLPEDKRIPGEDEYIKVNWYMWCSTAANTMYTLDMVDSIPKDAVVYTAEDGTEVTEAEAKGFILQSNTADGMTVNNPATRSDYYTGMGRYTYYSSYYPASQFEPDITYTFHNTVDYTLTEVDPEVVDDVNPHVKGSNGEDGGPDPQKVTTGSASATATYRYSLPTWKEPTGHFMIHKIGNDDKEQNGHAKNNITHRGRQQTGDLHLRQDGWYGIYPSALNDMQDIYAEQGEDGSQRLSYTIETIGWVMPWMFDEGTYSTDGELAPRKSINYTRPVGITTQDTGISIGRTGEKLQVGKDFDYVSVEFPNYPYVYQGKPHNINPDGSWEALTAGDGTFKYASDSDKAHWPDIHLDVQLNGEWQYLATASWQSGERVVTLADGAVAADGVVDLPEGAENFRTRVTLKNTATDAQENVAWQAGIEYDVRPVIKLRTTDAFMEQVNAAFSKQSTPSISVWNGANLSAKYEDTGEGITSFDNDGYDVLRGYTTDVAVYPYKSSRQSYSDVNYEDSIITIHYSARVEERSIINDKVTYEQAIEDGRLKAERHGVWRDLLPLGVTPDLTTVKLRDGDRVTYAYTEENYDNSGRTMLVVEADLTPKPVTYTAGDMDYYEDVPEISFDAYYDFDDYKDYGGYLHNVISFESSNDRIGTVEKYSGEPDNPYGDENGYIDNVSTPQAFDKTDNDAEKKHMTNLNPERDTPSFVYAGIWTNLNLLSAGNLGLLKDVMVNNDGAWSTGVYHRNYQSAEEAKVEPELQDGGHKRTVYEGGQYSYRLRMMPDTETQASDLIIYDSLEQFEPGYAGYVDAGNPNDSIDIDAPIWKGRFRGVDVSQLEANGCAPVVYYSSRVLVLSDERDTTQVVENKAYTNLSDRDVWTPATEWTGSLDDVKSIAIDASKRKDGTDFILKPLESGVVIVNMQAPDEQNGSREYISEDAHAYNNVFLKGTTQGVDDAGKPVGEPDRDNFIRKDYTKIGLREYDYTVTKRWNDDNNRDGKRPAIVTRTLENDAHEMVETEVYDLPFHLLADGADTGKVGYARVSDGKVKFFHLPYTTPEGKKVHYSVAEDELEGYTAEARFNENTASITNKHTPGRIAVEGSKIWVGDEEHPDARPESITVQLYKQSVNDAQPVQQATKTVKSADDGTWSYRFDNLLEYEDGQKIEYTVREAASDPKAKSYTTEVQGYDVVNTYHAYGDLELTKTLLNATSVSQTQKFPITFTFTQQVEGTDEEGNPVTEAEPIDASLDYDILEDGQVVESGTLTKENMTAQIGAGQTIHVKEIPEYVAYTVTEGEVAGFTQRAGSNLSGTIQPNQTLQAGITNVYAAEGQVDFKATKQLDNRLLKNYQFRYGLYQVVEAVDEDGNATKTEELVETTSSGKPDAGATQKRADGTIESSQAPINFGMRTYTEADAGKTFVYVMRETIPDDAQNAEGVAYADAIDEQKTAGGFVKNGYTYDSAEYVVKVAVEDNGDGTLSVVPTYYEQVQHEALFGLITWEEQREMAADAAHLFHNTYEATGAALPRAWKALKGGQLEADQFSFELVDQDGHVLQTKKNDETGTVSFDDLEYTESDIGNTYAYTVREVDSHDPHVNYDTGIWRYTVTVDDNGDGKLLPSTTTQHLVVQTDEDGQPVLDDEGNPVYVEEGDADAAPLFTNTLQPGSLKVAKAVSTPDSDNPDQEFTFTVRLMGEEVAGLEKFDDVQDWEVDAETGVVTFTVNLKADQNRTFEGVPAGSGYQVYEQNPEGWVIEKQEGVSGEIKALEESAAEITNKFQPDVAQAALFGTKLLDGKPAAAGSYKFALTAVTPDAPMPGTTEVEVADGGFIQFGPIEYDKNSLDGDSSKDFEYEIAEVDPEDPDVDYDTHKETVTVHVELNETTNRMSARVSYDDDGVKFENKTRPGNLRIAKVAENLTEANKDDVFTFRVKLANESGMPLGKDDAVYWYATDTNTLPDDASADMLAAASASNDEGETASSNGLAGKTSRRHYAQKAASGVMAKEVQSSGVNRALAAPVTASNKSAKDGGDLSETVKWTLYSDNSLVIEPKDGVSGSFVGMGGNSGDYDGTKFPWHKYRSVLTSITVKGKVSVSGSCWAMFRQCPNLEWVDLVNLETSKVTCFRSILYGNPKLKVIDVSTWDTSSATSSSGYEAMCWMFGDDPNLKYVDMSRMTTQSRPTSSMFSGSTNINVLVLGEKTVVNGNMSLGGTWTRLNNPDPTQPISVNDMTQRTGAAIAGVWVKNGTSPDYEYTVKYDANGGTGTPDVVTKKLTEIMTLPNAADVGIGNGDMAFAGWARDKEAVFPEYKAGEVYRGTPGTATTLYAVWMGANDYLIHYNANGGTSPKQWQRVNGADAELDVPEATRPNFTFAGWNTAIDGTGEWVEDGTTGEQLGVEAGDTLTLYAQWLDGNWQNYKVQYYRQNLDGNGYSLYETDRIPATINSTVTAEHKVYAGFTENTGHPETNASGTVAKNGTTVLKLFYDRNQYQVAFDGNGADSGQMNAPETFLFEEQKPLTKNSFSRKGYIFTGWNTAKDGSGTSYTDCQAYTPQASDPASTTLYAQWMGNEAGETSPTNGEIIVSCKAGQTIIIPDLPAGTTYTIEEIDLPRGWSQEGEIATNAESDIIAPNVTNTAVAKNAYRAKVEVRLMTYKQLVGDELANGQFSFQLLTADGTTVLQTVSNGSVDSAQTLEGDDGEPLLDDDGNPIANERYNTAPVSFEPISYTEADLANPSFEYVIREVNTGDAAVDYDGHEVGVRVDLADSGSGKLAATVTYSNENGGQVFTNSMKPATLHVTKTANDPAGAEPNAEFEFTVTLTDEAGNPLAGTYAVTKSGEQIGLIGGENGEPGVGTFFLKGNEQADIAGIPNNTRYTVTEAPREGWVQTSKTGETGLLGAAAEATASFVNTHPTPQEEPYDATGAVGITATKVVEGGVIDSADEFQFELLSEDGEVLQEVGTVDSGEARSQIEFDAIDYSAEDIGGKGGSKTFVYKLREVDNSELDESVAFDKKTYTVWVTATDNGDGSIDTTTRVVANVADKDHAEVPEAPKPVATADLEVAVSPASAPAEGYALGDVVELSISVTNKGSQPLENIVVKDALSGQSWKVDELDAKKSEGFVGTYTISAADALRGYVEDTVVASHAGSEAEAKAFLSQKVKQVSELEGTDGNAAATFTNKISRTNVQVQKAWVGDEDDASARPESIMVDLMVNGRVLQSYQLTAAENWQHTFENLPAGPDTTYSVREQAVKGYASTVSQDADGAFTITNTRVPNAKLEFGKYFYSVNGSTTGRIFDFTLVETDESGEPLKGDAAYSQTVKNGYMADGYATVSFGLEDLAVGEHYYRVSEEPAEDANVITDDMSYQVRVSVHEEATDDGGTRVVVDEPVYTLLDAQDGVVVENDDQPAFYNNEGSELMLFANSVAMAGYSGEDSRVSVYPQVHKYLDGSTAALAGNDYTFTLSGNGVERIQKNDVTGNVAFYDKKASSGLVFDAPGTYTYTITETIPDDATDNGNGTFTKDDVIYDASVITLAVTVTQDDAGVLHAAQSYSGMRKGTAPAFYNETTTPPTTTEDVAIEVEKFDGSTLERLGDASLVLLDADGEEVDSWTSEDSGPHTVTGLQPGASYKLVEEQAPDGYDAVADTEFTVSLDGSGVALTAHDVNTQLTGSLRIALYDPPAPLEEEVVEYKEKGSPAPKDKKGKDEPAAQKGPKTGDFAPIVPLAILAATGLVAFLVAGKRRREQPIQGKHAR